MDGKKVYPLKFEPVLEKTVWGGSTLKKFRTITDNEDYGISWEVSAHPNATNIIKNGYYKNRTLKDVIETNPKEILGNKVSNKEVLRISYINARDNLSVQVHPHVKELEQNEIWYILDAPAGAEVILGVNLESKEALSACIQDNKTESALSYVPVSKGDFIYIPGGLVHALTAGITVLEVGQNHDNTFRLFDYNRGREIHVEKSIEHTRFDVEPMITRGSNVKKVKTYSEVAYCGADFTIEMVLENREYCNKSDHDCYSVYTNLGSSCKFNYQNESIDFDRGESILIPAYLGEYTISGEIKLLKSSLSKSGKTYTNIIK